MEILDKIVEVLGYAVVNAEDGSVEEVKGSSSRPLGDLTAFFSSAGEVIKNSLELGEIKYILFNYGGNRLLIFLYESKYLGLEIKAEANPRAIIERIRADAGKKAEEKVEIEKKVEVEEKSKTEIPRSLSSKLRQINLLVSEFGGEGNLKHWLDCLNKGLTVFAGDLLPFVGIVENKLVFKSKPPEDKEEDFLKGLRTIIDFLVKEAVEEMGSSQARAKVQAVIERMK